MMCTKCNIAYSEGVLCEKCGQALVERADDLAPLLHQVDTYDNSIAEDKTSVTKTDEVIDYWSKTPELVRKDKKTSGTLQEHNSLEGDMAETSLLDDRIQTPSQITDTKEQNNSYYAGEFSRTENIDEASSNGNNKILFGIISVVVAFSVIIFLLRSAFFDKEEITKIKQSTTAVKSQVETTIDKQVLKDNITEKLSDEMMIIDKAIKEMHKNRAVPVRLAVSNGSLYSIPLQKYIELSDLKLDGIEATELYASNEGLIIGEQLADEYSYLVYNEKNNTYNLKVVADKQTFLNSINYKAAVISDVRLLKNGDIDRQLIYDQLIASSADIDDIFFRYLACDDQNAFAIWSPSHDYQTIFCDYLQLNDANNWQLRFHYQYDIGFDRVIADLSSIEKYNLAILPPVDPANFSVQYYEQADIAQITAYLKARGLTDSSSDLLFFSRINDNAYLAFSDGARLLILFKDNSKTSFDDIITMTADKSNQYYTNQLNCLVNYSSYYPFFLFTQ